MSYTRKKPKKLKKPLTEIKNGDLFVLDKRCDVLHIFFELPSVATAGRKITDWHYIFGNAYYQYVRDKPNLTIMFLGKHEVENRIAEGKQTFFHCMLQTTEEGFLNVYVPEEKFYQVITRKKIEKTVSAENLNILPSS